MAWYNHFSKETRNKILFSSLELGGKFRNDLHRNGRRTSVICIKTGTHEYTEQRNKKIHTLVLPEKFEVFELT